MITDLFTGNFLILYFIFVMSVFAIDSFNEKQKITIIYLCTYGIAWDEQISKRLLVALMTFMIFLTIEFFTHDEKKLDIIKKMSYKMADFLYMGCFQFKLWMVIISIGIRSVSVKEIAPDCELFFDIISIVIFALSVIWMYNVPEAFRTIDEIYAKVWAYPYYKFVCEENLKEGLGKALKDRLDIVVGFEDRLYWEREKAYTVVSFEHLKAWYLDRRAVSREKERTKRTIKSFLMGIVKLFHAMTRNTAKLFKRTTWTWVIRHISSFVRRGHSTIPMQLIRILSFRRGLVFGSSETKHKIYRLFKRKVYEVLYSRIFFEGLKEYIKTELCSGAKYYKEYLVYLYPHVVQTTIEKKLYDPASKYFDGLQRMSEWDLNKVVDMAFGFNGQPITESRILQRGEWLKRYDYKRLMELRGVSKPATTDKKKAKKRREGRG